MTPEITDLIKKKAEEKFPFTLEDRESWYIPQQSGYIAGQTEGIELMIGFIEWTFDNYKQYQLGRWRKQKELIRYTTIELLTKYIKEVLSK